MNSPGIDKLSKTEWCYFSLLLSNRFDELCCLYQKLIDLETQITASRLDFLKSPSSCLFSTRHPEIHEVDLWQVYFEVLEFWFSLTYEMFHNGFKWRVIWFLCIRWPKSGRVLGCQATQASVVSFSQNFKIMVRNVVSKTPKDKRKSSGPRKRSSPSSEVIYSSPKRPGSAAGGGSVERSELAQGYLSLLILFLQAYVCKVHVWGVEPKVLFWLVIWYRTLVIIVYSLQAQTYYWKLECAGVKLQVQSRMEKPIFRTLHSNLLIIRGNVCSPRKNVAERGADFSNCRVFKLFSVPLGWQFNVSLVQFDSWNQTFAYCNKFV